MLQRRPGVFSIAVNPILLVVFTEISLNCVDTRGNNRLDSDSAPRRFLFFVEGWRESPKAVPAGASCAFPDVEKMDDDLESL
jgi:hypothetical protein